MRVWQRPAKTLLTPGTRVYDDAFVNTLPVLMKNGATPLQVALRQLPNFSKLEATAIIINREVLPDETPESSLKLTYSIILGISAVVATPNRPVSPDSCSYNSVVEY